MSTMENRGQHHRHQTSDTVSNSSANSGGDSSSSEDDQELSAAAAVGAAADAVRKAAAAAAAAAASTANTTSRPSSMQRMRSALVAAAAAEHAVSDSDDSADDDDDVDVTDVDEPAEAAPAAAALVPAAAPAVPPNVNRKDERLLADLRAQIPDLFTVFNLHHRIGEGTFSTVFLATLRAEANKPIHKRRSFAIKHLIPTSHPSRVERELKCMMEIGGVDNVAGVDLCMRKQDAVAFIMPYVRHDKFHDYFNRFDAHELQLYMRNLLVALRRVHSFGIIHRDVKPSNFLHDRKAKKYLLVDFGLAQCVGRPAETAAAAAAAGPQQSSSKAAAAEAATVEAAATTTAVHHHPTPLTPPPTAPSASSAAAQQAISVSNSCSGSGNIPSSNSQSVAAMVKKRKAAELEETENCSNAADAKRPRPQPPPTQQQQHQTPHQPHANQQYSSVGAVNAATGTAAAAAAAAAAGATASTAVAPTSPFKSPLKQFNEISTPKHGAGQKKEDAPLVRHIKSAVLGYSIANKLAAAAAAVVAAAGTNSPPGTSGQHRRRLTAIATAANAMPTMPTTPTTRPATAAAALALATTSSGGGGGSGVACYCYGKPTICNLCIIKKEVHASRAGTPGYRPPEVLLKHTTQTTAVDMWAIGVIMISILSACYPFFKGTDDFTALAEMITIFGDEAIKKAALSMSRHVCHSQKKRPLHLRKLCIRLRNRSGANTISTTNTTRRPPLVAAEGGAPAAGGSGAGGGGGGAALRHSQCDNCQQILPECLCGHSALNMDFGADIFPASAYDLVARLLCINPSQRITAEEALQHPFMLADL